MALFTAAYRFILRSPSPSGFLTPYSCTGATLFPCFPCILLSWFTPFSGFLGKDAKEVKLFLGTYMSEKVFIPPWHLVDSLARYRILGWMELILPCDFEGIAPFSSSFQYCCLKSDTIQMSVISTWLWFSVWNIVGLCLHPQCLEILCCGSFFTHYARHSMGHVHLETPVL